MNTEKKAIRILTADDHALLREGIASLIEVEPDMELVSQAATIVDSRHRRSHERQLPPRSVRQRDPPAASTAVVPACAQPMITL